MGGTTGNPPSGDRWSPPGSGARQGKRVAVRRNTATPKQVIRGPRAPNQREPFGGFVPREPPGGRSARAPTRKGGEPVARVATAHPTRTGGRQDLFVPSCHGSPGQKVAPLDARFRKLCIGFCRGLWGVGCELANTLCVAGSAGFAIEVDRRPEQRARGGSNTPLLDPQFRAQNLELVPKVSNSYGRDKPAVGLGVLP